MKIAIISVSKKGYELSLLLKEHLDKDSTIINTDIYYKDVKNTFKLLFYEYDAIIAIMASGILIRSIAPLIKSKVSDPAILNIDENANFVISTLSGHLGGANKLTSKVADMLNATEVITTATDVNKKLGVDVIAKDLYLTVKNPKEIVYFNKAILNNEEIMFRVNSKENYDFLFDYLNDNTLEIDVSIEFTSSINTDEIHVLYKNHKLIMKIEDIVVGIGCKRGKSKEDILIGLNKALDDLNISKNRLSKLASGEIKKNEKGILDLSKMLNIPVNFVEMDKNAAPNGEDAQKVRVDFGANYSVFTYDEENHEYLKNFKDSPHMDGISKEQLKFENVIVLETEIKPYPGDEVIKYVDWEGGENAKGYYISEGKMVPITWSKASMYDPLKFFDANGNELQLNRGKSYIAFTYAGNCKVEG